MEFKRLTRTFGPVFLAAAALLFTGCTGKSGTNAVQAALVGDGPIVVAGASAGDPAESIYVRKVGNGPHTIVLVPGNNTSGAIFEGLMDSFRASQPLNSTYTVYTFDFRGSGYSSYNKPIGSLKDFASDFEHVMAGIPGFPTSGVTLAGYSMGFGVALEMVKLNPNRYSNIVSLTGIGTRGVRASFNASSAGTDPNGHVWANGDWIEIGHDNTGITATGFQQRAWQGDARSFNNIKLIWDMLVFEDVLKYNIAAAMTPAADTDTTFTASPYYTNALLDGLTIQYMPASLYYCHKFNVSNFDVVAPSANSDGLTVTIPGDRSLGTLLAGKKALLVKSTTDFANWRGDQVIYDNYTATTKYDLKAAGADTTAILVNANTGYDHGFPVDHPNQTAHLLDLFIQGSLTASSAANTLQAGLTLYPSAETTWETSVFTGF